ncbi:hypothetical protein EsH8_III_000441 [Colletotrichum jinshuiense]
MASAVRFTYLPILPTLATISKSAPTTLITAALPSATTLPLIPRAVSYTTVYVHVTPTAAVTPSASTHKPPSRPLVYGDLTWAYILLLLVPVIFFTVAVTTNFLERRRRASDQDIEMQTYHKWWFPWRELDEGEEPNEVSRSSDTAAPLPPSSLWPEDAPTWGRRHLFAEVAAYPSLLNPLPRYKSVPTDARRLTDDVPRGDDRREGRQETVAESSRAAELRGAAANDTAQIYGRTGSRRHAAPYAPEQAQDTDADSIAATTGRISPALPLGGGSGSSSPWAGDHIPSYYGDGAPSPATAPSAPAATTQHQQRRQNRFDLPSSSDSEDEAELQHRHAATAADRRAGKQPSMP